MLLAPRLAGTGATIIRYRSHAGSLTFAAGDLLLYPATSLHEVRPVTRGARLASFFWVQSMVRDDDNRRLLHEMDQALSALRIQHPDGHPALVRLTGSYHNLLRKWSEL